MSDLNGLRWALVMRDWSRGLSLGYYSIQPSHFNTRLPLHVNDEDLRPLSRETNESGCVIERPRSEFTETSYTIYGLEIAALARESADSFGSFHPRNGQKKIRPGSATQADLNREYEGFLARLPSHFRLGSSAGLKSTTAPTAVIPVHRWMLHQQIWSLFLRLHRTGFSSQERRPGLQLLAQNIITTQAQIQARCTICGTLSTNKDQVFKAAVLLLADLLSVSNAAGRDHPSVGLNRLMMRTKIEEAMELLKSGDHPVRSEGPSQELRLEPWELSARKNLLILEALMSLEEENAT
ncbi:MAG: hypothetical protein Q9180_009964, partial [Flavoplaca navasiana]